MSKEAMKLALERLRARTDALDLDAIAALNEALAEQPAQQQEPVGYAVPTFDFDNSVIKKVHYEGTVPLYTSPQQAQQEPLKLALEALELAQDNLRDHLENCFLHDEGEYNQCFCGKDSLSNHLQSVVEKLDKALAEQPAQQCWKCGDMDAEFQKSCNVPACGMKEQP